MTKITKIKIPIFLVITNKPIVQPVTIGILRSCRE